MKKKLAYKTNNRLEHLVMLEQARLTQEKEVKYTKKDVHEILGEFCGVGEGAIKRISYGKMQPSLPVAMRLSEYFNMPIEDIFTLTKESE